LKIRLNIFFYCLLLIACLFSSCQNKTKQLLVKKWDCVKVENLNPAGNKFTSKEDSVTAVKVEEALKQLSWTFNKNNTYRCSIGDRTTIQGTYEITADEKILICTPESKNNINSYNITAVSESELTLTSTGTSVPLILHFRPN
jgi:hypothetical protein